MTCFIPSDHNSESLFGVFWVYLFIFFACLFQEVFLCFLNSRNPRRNNNPGSAPILAQPAWAVHLIANCQLPAEYLTVPKLVWLGKNAGEKGDIIKVSERSVFSPILLATCKDINPDFKNVTLPLHFLVTMNHLHSLDFGTFEGHCLVSRNLAEGQVLRHPAEES